MGGTPVFTGTRVPIQAVFDFIKTGETLDEFLENFPTAKKDYALALLQSRNDLPMVSIVSPD